MFFYICLKSHAHICLYYFLILCSDFHLLFLTLPSTRDILLFTMFDSILLQPARNITEIRKTHYSSRRKKKCPVNHNQNKCSNIWYKVWVFLPPYSRSYSHIILWQKNLLTIFHITKLQITFQNKKITTFNKISF